MFRRHSILVAVVAGAAACDAPPPTAPRGPEGAAADKQGTTRSQLLLHIPVDDGNEGTQPEIFRMDDDGTNIVRLTYELGTGEYNASWAPDGKRVLFVRDYYDHAAIFVMNADGTGVTQLTTTQVAVLDQFPIAFGKQITFNRFEDGSYWIYIMNADGTGLTRLPQTAGGVYPAPSPKGGRIAFSRGGDIYLVDVTTGGLTNLTNSPVSEQDPAYSPSGKQIASARSWWRRRHLRHERGWDAGYASDHGRAQRQRGIPALVSRWEAHRVHQQSRREQRDLHDQRRWHRADRPHPRSAHSGIPVGMGATVSA